VKATSSVFMCALWLGASWLGVSWLDASWFIAVWLSFGSALESSLGFSGRSLAVPTHHARKHCVKCLLVSCLLYWRRWAQECLGCLPHQADLIPHEMQEMPYWYKAICGFAKLAYSFLGNSGSPAVSYMWHCIIQWFTTAKENLGWQSVKQVII